MNDPKAKPSSNPSDTVKPPKRSKQRYEKPAVIHSQSLEAMAAVCLPTPPGKTPAMGCTTHFS